MRASLQPSCRSTSSESLFAFDPDRALNSSFSSTRHISEGRELVSVSLESLLFSDEADGISAVSSSLPLLLAVSEEFSRSSEFASASSVSVLCSWSFAAEVMFASYSEWKEEKVP